MLLVEAGKLICKGTHFAHRSPWVVVLPIAPRPARTFLAAAPTALHERVYLTAAFAAKLNTHESY